MNSKRISFPVCNGVLSSIRHPELYQFVDARGNVRMNMTRIPEGRAERLALAIRFGHNSLDAINRDSVFMCSGGWQFDEDGFCTVYGRQSEHANYYRLVSYSLPVPDVGGISVMPLPKVIREWLQSGTEEELLHKLQYGIEIEFSEARGLLCEEEPRTLPELIEAFTDYYCSGENYEQLSETGQSTKFSGFVAYHIANELNMVLAGSVYYKLAHNYHPDQDTGDTFYDHCLDFLNKFSNVDITNDDEIQKYLERWECRTIGCRGGSDEWKRVNGWCHHPDGTSGIEQEYVTDSPVNFREMESRLSTLFSETEEFDCPENGSCHVHVSIPGRHHRLGDDSHLGMCILWELSQFFDDDVFQRGGLMYDRVNNDNARQYFSGIGTHQRKYSILHSHAQGSLEFRVFGHTDGEDTCLDYVRYAGLAFIRGYRRFMCGNTACLGEKSTFGDRFINALTNGEPLADESKNNSFDMSSALNISEAEVCIPGSSFFAVEYESVDELGDHYIGHAQRSAIADGMLTVLNHPGHVDQLIGV